MSNEISSYKLYEDLINMEPIDPSIINSSEICPEDDDIEMFTTSQEIIAKKEIIDRNFDNTKYDKIEESVHFKRYSSKRVHKYTDAEMNEIKKSCESTIIHDYGEYDIYHLSDEDRIKNDILSEISLKLGRLKRVYHRIDQYIEAMRVVFEAWNILEKNNYIHSREEFFEMVSKGEIVSNRILMPKMKGINKYNMDLIIAYVSNSDLDISKLVPIDDAKIDDSFYDNPETEEETMARLLSDDDANKIVKYLDNPMDIPAIKIGYIKDKYIKGYHDSNYKKRKLTKRDIYHRESLKTMLNKIQTSGYYKSFGSSYMITNSMFEITKKEDSLFTDIHFDGSWANSDEVKLYELIVEEEILKSKPVGERYLTYADKNIDRFFRILEDNGINTVDLRTKINLISNEDNEVKKTKLVKKENKQIESAILARISKLNEDPKFKKIVQKAENDLVKFTEDESKVAPNNYYY